MTRENKTQSQTISQQRRNKYVFSLFLNTDSDEADVTSLGRPRLQQQERHELL